MTYESFEELGNHTPEEILCPFLKEDTCSIYEVRPYVCAAYSASTPAPWCSPYYPRTPKVYRVMPERLKVPDLSFYYKSLNAPVILSLPLTVYELLTGGVGYLATLPGLEGLKEAFEADAEVKAIIKDANPQ